MNVVDATDRRGSTEQQEVEPPSLLTIIIDTNPHAWALLENSLPISTAIANLLVFINAHLAINYANRVAVVASHSQRAEWLYPVSDGSRSHGVGAGGVKDDGEDVEMQEQDGDKTNEPARPADNANKYRPFAQLEALLTHSIRKLMSATTADAISASPSTLMAGALTLALTYISKQTALQPGSTANSHFNYSDPSSVAGGNEFNADNIGSGQGILGLTSRIFILSVSGDLADKYIEIMNAIFACQRLHIPIDVLKLAGDSVFLQQAADTTGGTYMSLDSASRAGFLQYLMFAYLPDQTARQYIVMPGEGEGVDFRAACFCHKRIVDIGFVCSICLSIFCEPLADGNCLVCGSQLRMTDYGRNPIVVPKKKKKKKAKTPGADISASGASTPVPG